MASTVSSGFPEGLKADGYDWYWEQYDKLPKYFTEIFNIKKTDRRQERSTSAVGTGLLEEKPEDDNLEVKSPIEGYTVISKVVGFGKAERVSKELADDHQKLAKFLKSQMPQWAQDVVETQETFYANVFNYGGYTAGNSIYNGSVAGLMEDSSGDLCYDSIELFNKSDNKRSSKGGSTYYNGLALDLSKTNLQTAWTLMTVTNAKREDDTKIALAPEILYCNPNLKWDVDELIKSPDDPTTTNRAINVMHGLVRPIYNPYLTDTDAWTLVKPKFGLNALMRTTPEFDFWEDKLAKAHYMSIFVRFGVEIRNWRGLVGSNHSTS